MPTAIVTGQPVPGSSLESDLRSLGFDVRMAESTAETETLLAAAPPVTAWPWSTPVSSAMCTPCGSA
ncbi:hypothetical protein GTY20_29045 [Streptomyces sp. SID4946]|nr:hypothetical protein [Streptomyces sp. SID4946]SCF93102.1 hypothetical protein GA0115256_134534 [Streptomyces sp. DconLS]